MYLPAGMVDFYGKCREIYQSHVWNLSLEMRSTTGGGTWVLCVSSFFFSVICLLPGSGWGPESELRSASPEAVQWKHRPWRGKGLVFGEDGVMRGKGVKKLQKKNQDIFRMKVTYKEMSKGNAVAVLMEGCTPRKINMEHNHGGLVQIIFLSFHGWFVGSMLIFQVVATFAQHFALRWRNALMPKTVWRITLSPCVEPLTVNEWMMRRSRGLLTDLRFFLEVDTVWELFGTLFFDVFCRFMGVFEVDTI